MPTRRLRAPTLPLEEWLIARERIAHRDDALLAGYRPEHLRERITGGAVVRIRRHWLALPDAPTDLVAAAAASGRLACVSAARRRGWWLPDDPAFDPRVHVALAPHAAVPASDIAAHWSKAIVPTGRCALIESVEDTLQHVADCAPPEAAAVIWESAASIERLATDYLVRVDWRSPAARRLAAETQGLADSGLETIFATRLRRWGVALRLQVRIAGHAVDVLVGDRLIVQLDGWAHHSRSAERTRDVSHDAELAARGYTVLRFTYAQVMHDWPAVERAVARALAAGLHRRR